MQKKIKRKPLTIRLSNEVIAVLEKIAEETGRTIAEVIREKIAKAVSERKENEKLK